MDGIEALGVTIDLPVPDMVNVDPDEEGVQLFIGVHSWFKGDSSLGGVIINILHSAIETALDVNANLILFDVGIWWTRHVCACKRVELWCWFVEI